ncbi:RNA pseudouridine synthase [Thalassotalea sp. G2M2-11]|uniref:RluA family pseudouridine synthase n=1 Tax=Thalassotalea sp. G2M2-11 TaxID=2787627 RepID=UPI0019D081C0|nr:RNA pseudouridine synthase [Thalassotalea sp. G2M2-11]
MLKFELHLPVTRISDTIIDTLSIGCNKNKTPLSNAQIKSAIQKGALWLSRRNKTQRIRKLTKTLAADDTLHLYYDELVLSQQPPTAQLISDQHDYSIWYKPYGMLSQGSKWSDHCTIARWAETQLKPQRPAFIVHRLDRAASGLIIIAHSKKANKAFSHLFEQHLLSKHYRIICHGQLMKLDEQNEWRVTTPIDSKCAESRFAPIEYSSVLDMSLMDVEIVSGRKHQIRKHAASIGIPVVGDRLHGDKEKLEQAINLQLCAVSLAFDCPLSQQHQTFTLPEELQPSLSKLAK